MENHANGLELNLLDFHGNEQACDSKKLPRLQRNLLLAHVGIRVALTQIVSFTPKAKLLAGKLQPLKQASPIFRQTLHFGLSLSEKLNLKSGLFRLLANWLERKMTANFWNFATSYSSYLIMKWNDLTTLMKGPICINLSFLFAMMLLGAQAILLPLKDGLWAKLAPFFMVRHLFIRSLIAITRLRIRCYTVFACSLWAHQYWLEDLFRGGKACLWL